MLRDFAKTPQEVRAGKAYLCGTLRGGLHRELVVLISLGAGAKGQRKGKEEGK